MGKVQIQIIDQVNDVHGILEPFAQTDFPLALTGQIYDVNDLGRGKASYSKDFEIPATENNNKLLGFIFNTNSEDTNDYKGEKDIRLIVNGLQYTNYNKIRIAGVNLKNGSPHSYKAKLYGSNFEWASEFADLKINELDYHWMDGTVDSTTFTQSNANLIASFSTEYNDGWDFYLPLLNLGNSKVSEVQTVEQFIPCIYAKAILQRAATSIGWQWESDWLDNIANELLILFEQSNRKWDETEVLNHRVGLSRITTAQTIKTSINYGYVIFNNEITDPQNAYTNTGNGTNTNAGRFTCKKTGKYAITGRIVLDVGATPVQSSFSTGTIDVLHIPVSGSPYASKKIGVGSQKIKTQQTGFDINFIIDLHEDDTINILANIDALNYLSYTVAIGSYLDFSLKPDIIEDSEYEVSSFLPTNITVRDVLTSLSSMFNLRFDTNLATKTIICEPQPTFYGSTSDAIDWTQKIDKKSINVSFLTDFGRKFQYRYSSDNNDAFLKKYNTDHELPFAGLDVDAPTKAQFKETVIQSDFSPTVAYHDQAINKGVYLTTPYIPTIYKELADPSTTKKPERIEDFNTRILYRQGYVVQPSHIGNATWSLFSKYSGTSDLTSVPLALFTDPVNGGGLNLSYSNETIAGDGLFKTYHDPEFQTIRDGFMMNAKLNLTDNDVYNIDLKIPIYFDIEEIKGYWIINKIYDFDPLTSSLTTGELYKLATTNPITTETITYDPNVEYGSTQYVVPVNTGQQHYEKYKAYENGVQSVDYGIGNVISGGSLAFGNFLDLEDSQIGYGQYNSPVPGATMVMGGGKNANETATPLAITKSGSVALINPSFGALIYDGGENTVRSVAGSQGEPIIEGGLNEVRFLGATSYQQILDGGENSI